MSFDPGDSFNRTLLDSVRPADWTPPAPRARYDLVVIGGGTAGLVAAIGAAGLGAHVALVERARLGGDCLNTGCVPSKTLLASAHAAAALARAAEHGLHIGQPVVDFPAVMARVRRARATLAPHDAAARASARGVHVFFGEAAFAAPDVVMAGDTRLCFRRAVIATGARPAWPSIGGLDGHGVLTSESVFEITEQPRRLAVLGGGPIGCELAQAFARLGTTVFLFEAAPRLLPREDADASEIVRGALERDQVRVLTGAQAHHAERNGGNLRLTVARGSIGDTVDVDTVLVAVGRQPNTEGLRLDTAGIGVDTLGRVRVNDFLRTTNGRVYAAGDVCLPWQFTHAADASARIVVRNALFAGRARVSRLIVPRVTYTDPEVATVGMTLDEAAAAGLATERFDVPFSELDRAVTDGNTTGFVRILCRKGGDRIIGATAAGARGGEIMGEVVLAMHAGIGLGRLSRYVRAYPTYGGALGRAADAYNRTRLTPGVARALGAWLAWGRRLRGA